VSSLESLASESLACSARLSATIDALTLGSGLIHAAIRDTRVLHASCCNSVLDRVEDVRNYQHRESLHVDSVLRSLAPRKVELDYTNGSVHEYHWAREEKEKQAILDKVRFVDRSCDDNSYALEQEGFRVADAIAEIRALLVSVPAPSPDPSPSSPGRPILI